MNKLRATFSLVMASCLFAACGVGQPSSREDESLGSVAQAITAACNLNTIGLPCDPDGPANPKLECEGVCAVATNGLVACQPVTVGLLNGVICGTTSGVGDAACKRYCSGKTCLAANAPSGAACRPTNKGSPCDGACDGAGKCDALATACDFGRSEQLCTFATCNFANSKQCVVANLGRNTICSDANVCSIGKCDGKGACKAGPTVGCDDGNACTDDSCDPVDGGCQGVNNDANTCSDSNACTVGDSCSNGACIAGSAPLDCDDHLLCTNDSCDPNTGCANVPKCTDADACTDDVCDPVDGTCSHPAKACDDSNPCTVDSCDGATGCVFTPLDCDDADACTADSCSAGVCAHELTIACAAGGAGGNDGAGGADPAGGGDGSVDPVAGTDQGGSAGTDATGGTTGGNNPTAGSSGSESGGSTAVGGLPATGGSAGASTGATSNIAGTTGVGGSGPAAGGDPATEPTGDSSSGCSCRTAGETSSGSSLALLLTLAASAVLRRRRAA
jgi:MYXO-CTERM domain-containing protein